MQKIALKLKKLGSVAPNAPRKAILRSELIDKIRFYKISKYQKAEFLSNLNDYFIILFRSVKPVFIVVSGILFLVATTGVAAYASKPGQTLYSIKIAMERVPLIVPLVPEEVKLKTEVEQAKKRQSEIVSIIESKDSSAEKSEKIEEAAKEMSRIIVSTGERVQKIKQTRKGEAIKKTVVALQSNVQGIKKSLTKATQSRQAPITKQATNELDKVYVAVSNVELSTLEALLETVETNTVLEDKPQEDVKQTEDGKEPVEDNDNKDESTNKDSIEPSEDVKQPQQAQQKDSEKKKDGDTGAIKAHVTYNLNKAIQEIEIELKDLEEKIKAQQEQKEPLITDTPQEGEGDVSATVTEVILSVETILGEERRLKELQNIYDEIKISLDGAKSFMKKGDLKKALETVEHMRLLLQSIK